MSPDNSEEYFSVGAAGVVAGKALASGVTTIELVTGDYTLAHNGYGMIMISASPLATINILGIEAGYQGQELHVMSDTDYALHHESSLVDSEDRIHSSTGSDQTRRTTLFKYSGTRWWIHQ